MPPRCPGRVLADELQAVAVWLRQVAIQGPEIDHVTLHAQEVEDQVGDVAAAMVGKAEHEPIRTRATVQQVAVLAAMQSIVARTPFQPAAADEPVQAVIAVSTEEDVRAEPAGDQVIPLEAGQDVVAFPTVDEVVLERTLDLVRTVA